MALIHLEGIEVYSFHGYSKEERKIGGKYRIDLKVQTDTSRAEKSDRLQDTLNYERLFTIVHEQMAQSSKLLEHVGRKIINAIAAECPEVDEIWIKVTKLHPPLQGIMKSVSVEIAHKKPA